MRISRAMSSAVGLLASLALGATLTSCTPAQEVEQPEVQSASPRDDAAANEAYYQCMLDEGIPVTRGEDGSVSFEDPESKLQAEYRAADAKCSERLVADGHVNATTPESLRQEYRILSSLHECLVDQGFPLISWVTEDVFVDQKGEFNVLQATSPIDLNEAMLACPEQYAELSRP